MDREHQVVEVVPLNSSTSQPEAFAIQQMAVSPNNVPGHHTYIARPHNHRYAVNCDEP